MTETSERPLLPKVMDLRSLKPSTELLGMAQFCSTNLRGWTYRDIRKLLEQLPKSKDYNGFRHWITITFVKLKIALNSFHELDKYVWFVWKNCLTPEGQELYGKSMDVLSAGSSRPFKTTDAVLKELFKERRSLQKYNQMLNTVDKRLWFPLSTFPLWNIVSEGKMHLAFYPEPRDRESEIRELIRKFLFKYAPKEIFIPSPFACKKVGGSKYNDGGEVRRDSELPQNSYNSGFLYQQFVTKPGQSREVWLPGRAIKDNNGWWFVLVDNLLRKVPYSALLKESVEIYDQIKHRLSNKLDYFDVSGFGLQFPRNYLSIAIELIEETYPHPEIQEMGAIAKNIFAKVEVQVDKKFVYPSRGIGLGYYENLKTLIVMAIIDEFDPISVYGDQALLDSTSHEKAHDKLADFGFLFTKETKKLQFLPPFKWSGDIMSSEERITPRSCWSTIFGALTKEFHWERKAALQGVELPPEFKHVMKRVTFQYEKAFGPEFYKGESLCHPSNLGINPEGPKTVGWIKEWRVRKLPSPRVKYENGIFINIPWAEPPKRGESRRFSKAREKSYKRAKPFDTTVIDYVHPEIEMNMSLKPKSSTVARSMPKWAEIRNLIFANVSTGKLTYGLDSQGITDAPIYQRLAPDPWMARATGNYKIITPYYGRLPPAEEMVFLSECFNGAEKYTESVAKRVDLLYPRKYRNSNPYVVDKEDEEEVERLLLEPDPTERASKRSEMLSIVMNHFSRSEDNEEEDLEESKDLFEVQTMLIPDDEESESRDLLTRILEEYIPEREAPPELLHEFEEIRDEEEILSDYDPEDSNRWPESEPVEVYGFKV